jgi:hypothetical protein
MAKTEIPTPVSRMAKPPPPPPISFAEFKRRTENSGGKPVYRVTNITDGDIVFQHLDFLTIKSNQSIIIYDNSPMKVMISMSDALKMNQVKIEDINNLELGAISKLVVCTIPSEKNKYKFISEA